MLRNTTTHVMFLLIAAAAPANAHAQTKSPAALPSGTTVLARSIAATGADTALPRYRTMRITGAVQQPGQDNPSPITTVRSATGEFRMKIEIEGFGTVEQGYADGVAWSIHPENGPRILEGAQAAQAKRQAVWLDSPALYQSITTEKIEKFNGKSAYRVKAITKEGVETTRFYDVATGLVLGSESLSQTPNGPMPIKTLLSDYKRFGGVMMWTKQVQDVNGGENVTTIEKVEFNVVPRAEYALPASIAALRRGPK
jgi:zinc protease